MKSEQKRSNARSSIHIYLFYYEFMVAVIIQTLWSDKRESTNLYDEIK